MHLMAARSRHVRGKIRFQKQVDQEIQKLRQIQAQLQDVYRRLLDIRISDWIREPDGIKLHAVAAIPEKGMVTALNRDAFMWQVQILIKALQQQLADGMTRAFTDKRNGFREGK